jgi:acyl-CoA oxidase
MKSIKNLGTEKHLKYIERAATLEDIGCFCMTELAHGSDV